MSTFLSRMPGGSKQPDPVDVVADILRNTNRRDVAEALKNVYGKDVMVLARTKLKTERIERENAARKAARS